MSRAGRGPRRRHGWLWTALCVAALAATGGCDKYDTFSDTPSALLTFSADTVAFDTLIAGVGSATKTLYVFNRNSDGVHISGVSLAKGAASPFRVNVDGRYLHEGSGEDFPVYKRDSLVVRIEVTPPPTGTDGPAQHTDDLVFRLAGGATQTVRLTAGGLDARFLRGLVVRSDTTLAPGLPIVVYDSLRVDAGATLTLEAGTRLLFHDKAALRVHGRLVARGTVDNPVVLRGDRMDHMFDYLPYDNTPSRWEGVEIHEGSYGNELDHCDIHSACHGIVCDTPQVDRADAAPLTLRLTNSIVHNIGGDGLRLSNCRAEVVNTQVSNTLGHCLSLSGGCYDFIHCTIAQFYPFTADRGDALRIVHDDTPGSLGYLCRAHFINCVITGYGDDVIMGQGIVTDEYSCDYLFHNCFLNTVPGDDEERFAGSVYDDAGQPLRHGANFARFDETNFLYDFTPDSLSSIRGMADPAYAGAPRLDRLGRDRLADGAPDAGCYEYAGP